MVRYTILVGNDINNLSLGKSWEDLVKEMKTYFGVKTVNNGNKPFSMLYEEIFLSAVRKQSVEENAVKAYLAEKVSQITQNEIHQRIRQLPISDIITTNYEFTLEGVKPETNTGVVQELSYSIFRRYEVAGKTYWHIHGDCNYPKSINLGYEHYCGQLQSMRNYVVSGTNYKSNYVVKTSLISRLANKRELNYQSWIDFVFTRDIYIFGLSLDYVESDLWWLLIYRARAKASKKNVASKIKNTIHYFIPKKYEDKSKDKIELLKANDVVVNIINIDDRTDYYLKILDQLETL